MDEDALTGGEASLMTGVPESSVHTARARSHAGQTVLPKMGRPTLLTSAEEDALVNYIDDSAQRGFPYTKVSFSRVFR